MRYIQYEGMSQWSHHATDAGCKENGKDADLLITPEAFVLQIIIDAATGNKVDQIRII